MRPHFVWLYLLLRQPKNWDEGVCEFRVGWSKGKEVKVRGRAEDKERLTSGTWWLLPWMQSSSALCFLVVSVCSWVSELVHWSQLVFRGATSLLSLVVFPIDLLQFPDPDICHNSRQPYTPSLLLTVQWQIPFSLLLAMPLLMRVLPALARLTHTLASSDHPLSSIAFSGH